MRLVRTDGVTTPRRRSGVTRAVALLTAMAMIVTACGDGADDEEESDPADTSEEEPEDDGAEDDDAGDDDAGDDDAGDDDAGDDAAAEYFGGQDIEFLVPFGPGGGTDVTARAMAPFLEEYLGAGSLSVLNVPGAASIPGANEFALRGADDVDFMLTSATTHMAYILNEPGVRFEMKDWRPLMGIPTGSPTVLAPEVGFDGSNYEVLLDPEVPIEHAGISVTGADLRTVIAYELLEIPVEYTFGYSGLGPARLAFEQGEANSTTQSMGGYLSNVVPLVESGDAIPLFTVGILNDGTLERDPTTPEIPTISEVYEELHGEAPSGPMWEALVTLIAANNAMQKILVMHADTPDEKYQAALGAVERMLDDPEFQEAAEAAFGDYTPFVGPDAEAQMVNIADTDPEVVDFLYDYLAEEWDVDLRDE